MIVPEVHHLGLNRQINHLAIENKSNKHDAEKVHCRILREDFSDVRIGIHLSPYFNSCRANPRDNESLLLNLIGVIFEPGKTIWFRHLYGTGK